MPVAFYMDVHVPQPITDQLRRRGVDVLTAIRQAVEWTIERGAVFDFLAHPSCLGVIDPKFQTIDLITTLVRAAGPRAAIVGLAEIAKRARAEKRVSE